MHGTVEQERAKALWVVLAALIPTSDFKCAFHYRSVTLRGSGVPHELRYWIS